MKRFITSLVALALALLAPTAIAQTMVFPSSGGGSSSSSSSGSAGYIWSSATSPADNEWHAVAYSVPDGIFCAVSNLGTGNRAMSSPNGEDWTSRASAADNDWRGLAYSEPDDLFVAVGRSGTGNRVMTSPDCITWTSQTSASDGDFRSVACGAGRCVAVGASGVCMYSDNMTAWTSCTLAENNTMTSIAYGDDIFTAVSVNGTNRAQTSVAGVTWTARAVTTGTLYGVVYGAADDLWCAVSDSGGITWRSADGITWVAGTAVGTPTHVRVAYGNGTFVTIAITGGANSVQTTPDCKTWTVRNDSTPNFANEWYGLTFGDDRFVATSITGTGNRVMTSR